MRRRAGVLAALAVVAATVANPAVASNPTGGSQVSADGPSGMDLTTAWAKTKGDPAVVIAYVEGGINWHLSEAAHLVDHIFVNWHVTPVPCRGVSLAVATMAVGGRFEPCHTAYSSNPADYDVDGSGVINAAQWKGDPRVVDSNGNGYIDPEDLIAAFSAEPGADPANAYPHDISGWNFYRDDNDPATADATYSHSDDQMLNSMAACPNCMIMPVKAGAEALDSTDELAQAWLFACQQGVSVIDSVTADLGYSTFMRQVIAYCASRGVAMVEASNDFDSTDHQGGMFWPDVVPGNGVVPDNAGTAWTRSDYTSWGPHNMFSVAGAQTTSESTSTLGGLIGLLLSWGLQSGLSPPLTGSEAVQVLRETARPVTDADLPWPGSPGDWNLQYGYGIPDLAAAMTALSRGDIPPVASITSPQWYSVEDPTTTADVAITGDISAARSQAFSWTLQVGLGAQPGADAWTTIGEGNGKGGYSGLLGELDLSKVPRSFWSAQYHLSSTKELETTEQYAVTLRLVVTDAQRRGGIDRRAVNVVHDPTWIAGFPMAMGSSGESQPALVDLQGRGQSDLVFGTADGYIDAIDPATGQELPGWPAHTDLVPVREGAPGVAPAHQAIFSDVAVGDLDGSGRLSVVATTLSGQVYVFDCHGQLEPGWPQAMDTRQARVAIPRPALAYTRPPVPGSFGAPVLVHMEGPPNQVDVVAAGTDGAIHAWAPSGQTLQGWPVTPPEPPAASSPPPGYVTVDDQTLVATPTVAYLQGRDQPPDIVEASQVSETRGDGIQPLPFAFVYAYTAEGKPVSGWPVRIPGLVEDYDSALQFVLEGADTAVAADVVGTGADQVIVGAAASAPVLIDSHGFIVGTYLSTAPGGSSIAARDLAAGQVPPGTLADLPVAAASSGAIGRLRPVAFYAQPETGGLSTVGALEADNSGLSVDNYAVAYAATSGAALLGFPAAAQGLDFFGSPVVCPVGDGPEPDVVQGGDSNTIVAVNPTGGEAPGFPKWTTGWTFYGPTCGSLTATGQVDLVAVTREGYVMAWSTHGTQAADVQWPRWHHDDANTGNA